MDILGQGSFVVIFDESRSLILMHMRRDFRLWSLPGGHLQVGEAPEAAAIREAAEETGYQICIRCFVGEYWRPQIGRNGDLNYLYIGEIVGGGPQPSGRETVQLSWFDPAKLPWRRRPTVKQYVHDAVMAVTAETDTPFKKTLHVPFWQIALRQTAVRIGVLRP